MSDELVQALNRIAKALEDNAASGRESLELHKQHQALFEKGEAESREFQNFQREESAKREAHDQRTRAAFDEMIDTFKKEALAVEERFKTSEANTDRRFHEWERRLAEVERGVAANRGQPS